MENVKNILEEYQEGDVETRINLFLQYRGLREEFKKIDHTVSLIHQKNYYLLKEEKQMNNIHTLNIKSDETHPVKNKYNAVNSDLMETYYCDFSNKEIKKIAKSFLKYKQNTRELVAKTFLYVRDEIAFGGDRWKVKASETLNKGYGACYNKNLLLVALLRYYGIPAKLCANPMAKDFNKAAIGFGYITMSTPFYHCFTKVLIDEKWIDIDPTVDKSTYNTFFAPLNVDWSVDWDGYNDMILFKGATIGEPKILSDIDGGLNKNLNSHFLFRYEPEFLLSSWLSSGNSMMWKKVQKTIIKFEINDHLGFAQK